jgi:hypothetical protein
MEIKVIPKKMSAILILALGYFYRTRGFSTIVQPLFDRLKREPHDHGKARQAHSLFNVQN